MEIIPAILESNWPEVEKKIKLVDGLTDWIQLDVSDGEFTQEKTWDNSQDLFSLQTKSKIEIHLMIKEPWLKANEWFSSPAKRIIAHVEAFSSPESLKFGEVAFSAQKYGKEIVWGFNAQTDWEPYKELMQKVTWPAWSELQGSAIVVMVASLVIAVIVYAMDTSFSKLLKLIYSMFY